MFWMTSFIRQVTWEKRDDISNAKALIWSNKLVHRTRAFDIISFNNSNNQWCATYSIDSA